MYTYICIYLINVHTFVLYYQAPSSSTKKLSQPAGQGDGAAASEEAAAMMDVPNGDDVDGNGSDNEDAGAEQDGERLARTW